MKYFIIHSRKDWDKHIDSLLQNWLDQCPGAEFVAINDDNPNWTNLAKLEIVNSDKVIYIVGDESSSSDNIKLEIDLALQAEKTIYIYKLDSANPLNSNLQELLSVNNHESTTTNNVTRFYVRSNKVEQLDEVTIISSLQRDCTQKINDLSNTVLQTDNMLLEQYKLFVTTSEDLVKRKQGVNQFYVTLNSIIVSAVITVLCALGKFPLIFGINASCILAGSLAVLGGIVCFSWISMLSAYGKLNSGKMDVIINIEKKLPLNLFDKEWEMVVGKYKNKKYVSFTKKEKSIAIIFATVFAALLAISIILAFFI